MISDPELIIEDYPMNQTKQIKFRWLDKEKLEYMTIGVAITYEMLNGLSFVSPWHAVRLHFAKSLADNPDVLYQALLAIDRYTNQAMPLYSEIMSYEYTDPIAFDTVGYSLGEDSQQIYNNVFYKTFPQKLNDISVSFKIEADKLNQMTEKLKKIKFDLYAYQNKPSLSQSSENLPGINEKVKFPCNEHSDCHGWYGKEFTLHSTIMRLNDVCKWRREEIADWIETLDIDTTFKTNTKEIENVEGR